MKIIEIISPFIVLLLLTSTVSAAGFLSEKKTTDQLKLELKIRMIMRLSHLPSLNVRIIKNDSIIFSHSYGFSNHYLRRRAENDTIYMIGSISKSIIATALMQLYEEGKFSLNDSINKYLPFDIKNPYYPNKNITFKMLLAHEASINDFGIKPRTILPIMIYARRNGNISYILKEMMIPGGKWYSKRYWFDKYGPGDVSCYSNQGYVIAGYLLERLSGMSIENYCRKYIFKPLDMNHTSFIMKNIDRKKVARPYTFLSGFYIPLPRYDFHFLDAAAGVYTTAEDLSHFLIAHMNGGIYKGRRILNESTVRLMHSIQSNSSDIILRHIFGDKIVMYHGIGWFIIDFYNMKLQGHSGGTVGYNCHMLYFKNDHNERIGIILLSNGPLLEPAFLSQKRVMIGYLLLLKVLLSSVQ